VKIKDRYAGKRFSGSYIKPKWDDIYTNGRSGETPMEYDYGMTISTIRNWRGIPIGERDWRKEVVE